jgi:hypothetical protein
MHPLADVAPSKAPLARNWPIGWIRIEEVVVGNRVGSDRGVRWSSWVSSHRAGGEGYIAGLLSEYQFY